MYLLPGYGWPFHFLLFDEQSFNFDEIQFKLVFVIVGTYCVYMFAFSKIIKILYGRFSKFYPFSFYIYVDDPPWINFCIYERGVTVLLSHINIQLLQPHFI